MKIQHTIVGMVLLAAISCRKDKEEESIPSASFTIVSPSEGQTFAFGDTIVLHAVINCPTAMHGWEGLAINTTSGDSIWEADMHEHSAAYVIIDSLINQVDISSDMRWKLTAEVDHDGHTNSREIIFHCEAQ